MSIEIAGIPVREIRTVSMRQWGDNIWTYYINNRPIMPEQCLEALAYWKMVY